MHVVEKKTISTIQFLKLYSLPLNFNLIEVLILTDIDI